MIPFSYLETDCLVTPIRLAKSSYASKYKISLSNNNNALQRQMVIDPDNTPPYGDEPFYALLVFGGGNKTFSAVQG